MRYFWSVLFLVCFFFAVTPFTSSASTEEPKEERYYVGIGIKLNGVRIKEVLRGGPAEAAGIRQGDLILSVNGALTESIGESGIAKAIGAGNIGEAVHLTIVTAEQPNAEGKARREIVTVAVARASIDRVAWLPLDEEIKTVFGVGDKKFIISTKLSEDREKSEFVYRYRLTNELRVKAYFQWDILDQATGVLGVWNGYYTIILMPGETKNFVLRSPLLPAFRSARARVLVEDDGFGGNPMAVEGGVLLLRPYMGSDAAGFLPEKWLKDLSEE